MGGGAPKMLNPLLPPNGMNPTVVLETLLCVWIMAIS
jgi:hypothetical protein